MPNAKFEIKINKTERFCENGIDEVEFMICTNIGEELKPLVKIASGGENGKNYACNKKKPCVSRC